MSGKISDTVRMTLRELRERAGFRTTARLAAETGILHTTISKIEGGKVLDPRYSTVAALAAALRVSMPEVKRAIEQTVREAA